MSVASRLKLYPLTVNSSMSQSYGSVIVVIIPHYYMAVSHKDWNYRAHKFDWLNSVLKAV